MTTLATSGDTFAGTEASLEGTGTGHRHVSWWAAQAKVDQNANGGTRHAERIVGLSKWEGRILEISGDLLSVELTPSDHDGPELVADFDLDLLGPDSSSASVGDIVYLTTRTIRDAAGYPHRTSSLKLRRPGVWAEGELREIREAATRKAEFFKGLLA